MAPMPDPMPVATAMRPSAGSRSSIRARSEPNPALIWPGGAFSPTRTPRADGKG